MPPAEAFSRRNGLVDSGWLAVLNPIQLAVWTVMDRHADSDGIAWPGSALIAKRIGHKNRDHIRQAKRDLVRLGLLELVTPGKGSSSARYRVLVPTESGGTVPTEMVGTHRNGVPTESGGEVPTDSVLWVPTKSDHIRDKEGIIEQHKGFGSAHKAGVCDTSAHFDAFWSAWPKHPRKVNRAGCAKKWASQKLDSQAEQIMAALESAKDSADWKREGGRFVPLVATWLNQRRWESFDGPEVEQEWGPGIPENPVTVDTPYESLGDPIPAEWEEAIARHEAAAKARAARQAEKAKAVQR